MEYTVEVYEHDAFILTHGVEVKDEDGQRVWSNLFSSETKARETGMKKAAELSRMEGV